MSHEPIPPPSPGFDRHDLALVGEPAPRAARPGRGRASAASRGSRAPRPRRPRPRSGARRSRAACGRCRSRRTGRASSSRSTGRGGGGRPRASRAGPAGIAATLADVRSICLWRSLISRYLTWKLRQNPPRSQRASGRCSATASMEERREHGGLLGRQRPLAHLGVRARSGRRPGRSAARARATGTASTVVSQSAFSSSASKNRSTQRPSPQQCSNVVGQAPNFSPSSPIMPDAVAGLGRVVAQVADHVLDGPERDPVAQALLRAEHRQQLALVLGRVRRPTGSPPGSTAARKCWSSRIVQR